MLQTHHLVAGRYRVFRHIATGGMGAVYEAEHVATEARVALKVLLPHMLQVAAARRRFELEAKVSARVDSEHIVRVFDAGVDEATGSPYLAMELLSGETLAARVRHEGPLPAPRAIELLRQVARGLDAAHGYRSASGAPQPIVHRDLKPENVFLARRADGTSLVKIVDFGIAKVLSDATAVTREVRGTPLYMAYEQVAGESVSPQTDVWALGLLAHFMLTGQTYWSTPGNGAPTTEALYAQILTLPLPRPSQRLRDAGVSLPEPAAFDTWLLTCLDRQPTRRFPSAGAAVTALERALTSASAAPPSVRRLLGGRFASRVTARFELPTIGNASTIRGGNAIGNSNASASATITSVPPVASKRGRRRDEPQERRGPSLRLSGLLALVGAVTAGVTWGVASVGLHESPPDERILRTSSEPAGATGAPAPTAPPARGAGVAPAGAAGEGGGVPTGSGLASAAAAGSSASPALTGGAASPAEAPASRMQASHAPASHAPASGASEAAPAAAPRITAPPAPARTDAPAPTRTDAPAPAPTIAPAPAPTIAPAPAAPAEPPHTESTPPAPPPRAKPSQRATAPAPRDAAPPAAPASPPPHGAPPPPRDKRATESPCAKFDPYTGRCSRH